MTTSRVLYRTIPIIVLLAEKKTRRLAPVLRNVILLSLSSHGNLTSGVYPCVAKHCCTPDTYTRLPIWRNEFANLRFSCELKRLERCIIHV